MPFVHKAYFHSNSFLKFQYILTINLSIFMYNLFHTFTIWSDFGLATELKDSKKASKDGLYKLTEMTGSPVYMAPEGNWLCTAATRKIPVSWMFLLRFLRQRDCDIPISLDVFTIFFRGCHLIVFQLSSGERRRLQREMWHLLLRNPPVANDGDGRTV